MVQSKADKRHADKRQVEPVDAIELLDRQHERALRRFDEFELLDPLDRRRSELARTLVHEVRVHVAIEEQAFYPTVREAIPELDTTIARDLEDYARAKRLLAELHRLARDDDRFEATFRELVTAIRAHVRRARTELFPQVRRTFSALTLDDLGLALETLATLAPDHLVGDGLTIQWTDLLGGPAGAALDRARDAAQRIRDMVIGP